MDLCIWKVFMLCLSPLLVQGVEDVIRKSRECTPSVTVKEVTPSQDISYSSINHGIVPDLKTCAKRCCYTSKLCDIALFDGKYCQGIKCSRQHACLLLPSKPGQRSYNAAFFGFALDNQSKSQEQSSKKSEIPKAFGNESETIIKALEEMSKGEDEVEGDVMRQTSSFPTFVTMATRKPFVIQSQHRGYNIYLTNKRIKWSKTKVDKTKAPKKDSINRTTLTQKIDPIFDQNLEKTLTKSKKKNSFNSKQVKNSFNPKFQVNNTNKINLGLQNKEDNIRRNHVLKQTNNKSKAKIAANRLKSESKLTSDKVVNDSIAATEHEEECYVVKIVKDSALRAGMNAGKFTIHKLTNNITECVEYCCSVHRCDVAVIMAGTCYSVQCKSEHHCESKSIGGKSSQFNPVLAYVHNGLSEDDLGHHFIEVQPPEENLITKKTVVPDPSQGDIGTLLGSLQFRNGPSLVRSSLELGYFQQCGLYVEPDNVTKPGYSWNTDRLSPYPYLYQFPSGTAPPLGLRSAVPLGGIGTGSFEIRADGSFSDWTLENQSPGGSAKLGRGALDLAVFGVRVESEHGSKSALLRTHPPKGFPGVQAMAYSGAYPVSKLTVVDDSFYGISIALYAFGTLHTRKTTASFVPAVTFTLNIQNPTDTTVNISFLFNLPLGLQPDTSRNGANLESISNVISPSVCASMCNNKEACMAWEHEDTTCFLKDTMPLHAYKDGISSGVKGQWQGQENQDSLTLNRPGKFPNSGTTTVLSANTNKPTFAIGDGFSDIWESFKRQGFLKTSVRGTGFNGAIAVSAKLPAGEGETLTFIMAWHYPNRDHAGLLVGNYYSHLFKSSKEVARYTRNDIQKNLQDIIAFQSNLMPSNSRLIGLDKPYFLPTWLQDHLVNSLSFWRSGFRVGDGRWRQWEAYDCNDLDSVHNDFQREIPYILFFPDLLENVVRAWAKYQQEDGLVLEALQPGCHGRTAHLDTAGGRVNMADVNAAFITQVYHLYLWTASEKLLRDLWPSVRKAAVWLIDNSTEGSGLPLRRTNTYDQLHLENYDHSMYNSVMYLLSMRVTAVLAETKRDKGLKKKVTKAFTVGLEKIEKEMWDKEKGFYHAWWDRQKGSPDWLMADSLYGQVWAYTLGLGPLLDPNKMRSHLKKELELNDTPYGLRVMTTGEKNRRELKRTKTLSTSHVRSKREVKTEDPFKELKNFFTGEDVLNKNKNFSNSTVIGASAGHLPSPDVSSGSKHSNIFKVKSNESNATDNVVVNSGITTASTALVHGKNKESKTRQSIDKEHLKNIDKTIEFKKVNHSKKKVRFKVANKIIKLVAKEKNGRKMVNDQATNSAFKESHHKNTSNSSDFPKAVETTSNTKTLENASNSVTNKNLAHNVSNITKYLRPSIISAPREGKKIVYEKTRKTQSVGLTQEKLKHFDCGSLDRVMEHESIWMGSGSDWSALQIHLGMEPRVALSTAQKSLEHYRAELNDLWNIHGLTAGQGYNLDGRPWCTSHYTFHLVLWHIPFAISGQRYSAIEETLEFEPRVNVPYVLPFFIPSSSGTIESKRTRGQVIEYTLTVTSGILKLKFVSLNGKMYGTAVVIKEGDFIKWNA